MKIDFNAIRLTNSTALLPLKNFLNLGKKVKKVIRLFTVFTFLHSEMQKNKYGREIQKNK